MASKLLLAAGVFSLSLVGLPGSAQAESTDDGARDTPDRLTFFGRTFCLPHAPPDVDCDVRMPGAEDAERTRPSPGTSFALFGKRWCVGAGVTGPCDVRLPAAGDAAKQASRSIRLFGTTICFGDLPGPECDLTIPPIGSERDQRRASL